MCLLQVLAWIGTCLLLSLYSYGLIGGVAVAVPFVLLLGSVTQIVLRFTWIGLPPDSLEIALLQPITATIPGSVHKEGQADPALPQTNARLVHE